MFARKLISAEVMEFLLKNHLPTVDFEKGYLLIADKGDLWSESEFRNVIELGKQLLHLVSKSIVWGGI